MNQTVFMSH